VDAALVPDMQGIGSGAADLSCGVLPPASAAS